jgi:hypothetical protein
VVHQRSVCTHSVQFDKREYTAFRLPVGPSTQRFATRDLLADQVQCPLRSPVRDQALGFCQQVLDLTTNLVSNSQQFTGTAKSSAPQFGRMDLGSVVHTFVVELEKNGAMRQVTIWAQGRVDGRHS